MNEKNVKESKRDDTPKVKKVLEKIKKVKKQSKISKKSSSSHADSGEISKNSQQSKINQGKDSDPSTQKVDETKFADQDIPETRKEFMEYGTQANPYLEKMRGKPRTTMHWDKFKTSDGLSLFYRRWIPKDPSLLSLNDRKGTHPGSEGTSSESSEIDAQPKSKPKIKAEIQSETNHTLVAQPAPKFEKLIVCLHGLHSHGQKFVLLADYLADKPWRVIAPDLRGHGLSWNQDHPRGDIEDYNFWIYDCQEFIGFLRNKYPQVPIYIVAESMGAALAVLLTHRMITTVKGLILISPALKPFALTEIGLIQKAFAYGILGGADEPNIRDNAQGRFSSNSEEYITYQMNDHLRLARVTPRYYYQVIKMIHQLKPLEFAHFVPSCLFYGDKDHLVDFTGMKEFIRRLGKTDKSLHYIPDGFHELFTDEFARKYHIFQKIKYWIRDH